LQFAYHQGSDKNPPAARTDGAIQQKNSAYEVICRGGTAHYQWITNSA
jgi:hypothetical protein